MREKKLEQQRLQEQNKCEVKGGEFIPMMMANVNVHRQHPRR